MESTRTNVDARLAHQAWDPFDPPFAQFLGVTHVSTLVLVCVVHDTFLHVALATQTLCLANVWLRSRSLQYVLHDVFVYCVMFGNLMTVGAAVRAFAVAMTALLLATRVHYDRCIFLGWQTSRNVDFDVLVALLIGSNCARSGALVADSRAAHAARALVGMISHGFSDRRCQSRLVRMWLGAQPAYRKRREYIREQYKYI